MKDRGNQLSRVRVLLADDNPAILSRATEMLQADYQIVGPVTGEISVCMAVENLGPDLIVMNTSMGARSGIEIAEHLRKKGYAGEIVFLTVHEDPDFVIAAIDAEGRGYEIKSRMNVDLTSAIKSVLSHQIFVLPPFL